MKDNRYELAERHGMSKEFIDWFFDKKKNDCGNLWFMTMAVMWEGWNGALSEPIGEIVERESKAELSTPGETYPYLRGKLKMERMPVGTKFYAIQPKSD